MPLEGETETEKEKASAGEAAISMVVAMIDKRKYFVFFDSIINSKYQASNHKQIPMIEIQNLL